MENYKEIFSACIGELEGRYPELIENARIYGPEFLKENFDLIKNIILSCRTLTPDLQSQMFFFVNNVPKQTIAEFIHNHLVSSE